MYDVELNTFIHPIYASQSLHQKMENEPKIIDYFNTHDSNSFKCNYVMKESEQLMWVPHSLYSRYKQCSDMLSVTVGYIFNKPRLN